MSKSCDPEWDLLCDPWFFQNRSVRQVPSQQYCPLLYRNGEAIRRAPYTDNPCSGSRGSPAPNSNPFTLTSRTTPPLRDRACFSSKFQEGEKATGWEGGFYSLVR